MQSHKIRADLKEKFKIKNLFLLKKGNDYFIFRSGFEIYSVYFNIEDFNSVKERLEKLDKNFEEYDLKLIIISIEKEGLLNYIKKKLISDYFIIKFVKLIKKIHNKYNTKLENFNYITQIRYDCKLDDENFVNENLDKIQNLLLNIKTVNAIIEINNKKIQLFNIKYKKEKIHKNYKTYLNDKFGIESELDNPNLYLSILNLNNVVFGNECHIIDYNNLGLMSKEDGFKILKKLLGKKYKLFEKEYNKNEK